MVFQKLSPYDVGAQLRLRSPAPDAAVGKQSPMIMGSLSALCLHPQPSVWSLELLDCPALG